MSREELIGCASGARCSCAAGVAADFLNAADVVAVVAPAGEEARLGESVRGCLESTGARVFHVRCDQSPCPACTLQPHQLDSADGIRHLLGGSAAPAPDGSRAVLLWHGVDQCLLTEPEKFDRLLHLLSEMVEPRPSEQRSTLNRVVFLGGPELQARLASIAERLGERLRFRYLLVH